ncbi:MAG TPA: hypothetical protein VOA64_19970 [Candidatus Dormibacteraeota bacterium]|nr:hypothetical protein [Candidatus Dormibacteraeota bacterium]
MKQTRFVIALLSMVIGSAHLLLAQKPTLKTGPAVSVPDLAKLSIGKMLEQMQTTTIAGNGEAPSPIQIVVQFLQLRPDQVQEFGQLLQARQAAVVPLLPGIQQRVQQLEALLNSGSSPADVGMLVIQIHTLQQEVAQVQQDFLSKFGNLIDPEQQQRLEAVRIAVQLQPILAAFQQLYLF